jgi:hypothetical protein
MTFLSMKNTISIACLLFISTSAFAQIPRGTSTVGGLVSFSHEKEKRPYLDIVSSNGTYTNTTSMAAIKPEYGRFVANNLCVGLNLSLLLSSATTKFPNDPNDDHSNTRGITVGPFVRYYVPATEKLYGVFGAGFNWGQTKTEAEAASPDDVPFDYEYRSRTSGFDLSAGLAYFVNPNAAIEGTIGYTNVHAKNRVSNDVTKNQQYGLGIALRIFLRKS